MLCYVKVNELFTISDIVGFSCVGNNKISKGMKSLLASKQSVLFFFVSLGTEQLSMMQVAALATPTTANYVAFVNELIDSMRPLISAVGETLGANTHSSG